MKKLVLIPAYMPDEKMIGVSRDLYIEGFEVIVVNDGSPSEFDATFERVKEYAVVLRHDKNRGKGEALSVRSGRRGRIPQPVVSCSPQNLLTRQQKNRGRSQAFKAWLQLRIR